MSETMPQIESQTVNDAESSYNAETERIKAETAHLKASMDALKLLKEAGASDEELKHAMAIVMARVVGSANELSTSTVDEQPTEVASDIAPEPVEPMFAENNIETEIDTTVAKEEAAQVERKYEQLDVVKYVDPEDKNIYTARVIEAEDENGMVKIDYPKKTIEKHLLGKRVEVDIPAAVLRSMAGAKQPEKVETPKQPGWIATWISERKAAKQERREAQSAERTELGATPTNDEQLETLEASIDNAESAAADAEAVLAEAEQQQAGKRRNRILYELTSGALMSRLGNLASKAKEKARDNKKKTLGLGIIAAGLTIGAIYAGNKYGLDTDGFKHMAGDIGDIFNGDDGTSAKASTGDVSGIQLGEVIPETKKEPLPITDTGYSFNVEPGHGYTQELVDYAQAHNANLSPEQSLDLHNHLVEQFGNYITDGGSYTQGGELRLGETGQASYKPGVVTEIDKYLSSHR